MCEAIDNNAMDSLVDSRISSTLPGFNLPFFQAGLAGFSDGAMRAVARQQGCPYCVTEALLDSLVVQDQKHQRQEDLLDGDHPIAGQLLGTDPDTMAQAAVKLVSLGYEVIDLNFACPVKKVHSKRRGGHWLGDAKGALKIVESVRSALPADIPLSLKLRIALDDTGEMRQEFDKLFAGAYELGICWATVHCRTVEQKYKGAARWSELASLTKRYPDHIIFGSGDIWQAEDVSRMLEQTGVQAVAVARGCIGNPWFFTQAKQLLLGKEPQPPKLSEQAAVLLEHLRLAEILYGPDKANLHMRKFAVKFAEHHPEGTKVKAALTACQDTQQWRSLVDKLYC